MNPTRLLVLLGLVMVSACGRAGLLPRVIASPGTAMTADPLARSSETASRTGAAVGVAAEAQMMPGPAPDSLHGPHLDEPESPGTSEGDDAPPPAWDIDVTPYESHARVEHFVQRFSGPLRGAFENSLERQSRYAPMIHERLRAGGLPEDMIYLPLIESWYDVDAYSIAAAVGMWQFMTATARGVGLRVDWWVDERRDPVRSTDAAVTYLNELRENFGSIYLSAAAYNGGPGRVSRGLSAHADALEGAAGDALFFALSDNTPALRAETRDYVPKLIAAALVGKNPKRYGVEIRTVEPFRWDSVLVEANVPLAAVAKAASLPIDSLRSYNPQILRGMTPPSGKAVWLRVPVGSAAGFSAALASLPEAERTATKRVVTKEGDFIAKIARANGLTAEQLNWYNPQATRLKNGNLHAGQRILVPRKDVVELARKVPNPAIERYGASSNYVVKQGDSLGLIARRNGTTVERIKQLNGLKSDVIRVGQSLRVR
jgi:membrane-bound lytic murein transglycosylase D